MSAQGIVAEPGRTMASHIPSSRPTTMWLFEMRTVPNCGYRYDEAGTHGHGSAAFGNERPELRAAERLNPAPGIPTVTL